MVTESKKSVHFKYVISACCFSTCGSITYSASICLMSQYIHFCLTPSTCLPWRIMVVNVSLTLPLSFSNSSIFLHPWYLKSLYVNEYFINACSVKKIFQESKHNIFSSCHAYHLITQRSFTILSFLVKTV